MVEIQIDYEVDQYTFLKITCCLAEEIDDNFHLRPFFVMFKVIICAHFHRMNSPKSGPSESLALLDKWS